MSCAAKLSGETSQRGLTPILSVRNLSTGDGKKPVLFDVNLDVMPGEIVLITAAATAPANPPCSRPSMGCFRRGMPMHAQIIYRPEPDGAVLSTNTATNNVAQGLAYLPQKNAVFDDLTVEDNLRLAGHILLQPNKIFSHTEEVSEKT